MKHTAHTTVRFFSIIFLLCICGHYSYADERKSVLPQLQQALEEKSKGSKSSEEITFIEIPNSFKPNLKTEEEIQKSVQKYYNYRISAFEHRLNVLNWQHFSSQIILFIVIIVVFVGLYFSWIQFHKFEHDKILESTTIEASKAGMKISSPVLGVIILAISLVFFYLYLIHVYPVRNTF